MVKKMSTPNCIDIAVDSINILLEVVEHDIKQAEDHIDSIRYNSVPFEEKKNDYRKLESLYNERTEIKTALKVVKMLA